jgi:hypothetical protein
MLQGGPLFRGVSKQLNMRSQNESEGVIVRRSSREWFGMQLKVPNRSPTPPAPESNIYQSDLAPQKQKQQIIKKRNMANATPICPPTDLPFLPRKRHACHVEIRGQIWPI